MKHLCLPSPIDTLFMRFFIAFFVILSASLTTKSQNLVPNPSFEDLDFCPYQINQIEAATGWFNCGGTPECLNACNNTGLSVPQSTFGYNYAHTGVGMAGIVTYRRPNSPSGPNYREFISNTLTNSLQVGVKYFVSYFVNCADPNYLAIASNNMGIRFSTVPFNSINTPPLTNQAHINSYAIINDTVNFIKVSGSFIADSSYNYLIIGNFFTDSLTNIQNLGPFPDYAYNFVDDICVSTDSVYCSLWTGLVNNEFVKSNIFYPNPSHGTIYSTIKNSNNKILVFDMRGKKILEFANHSTSIIDLSFLPASCYFIRISTNHGIITEKIILNP